jgi:hypothetical protein
LTRPSIFIRDKPIILSERMLCKDYDGKGSVGEKKYLVVSFMGHGSLVGQSPASKDVWMEAEDML